MILTLQNIIHHQSPSLFMEKSRKRESLLMYTAVGKPSHLPRRDKCHEMVFENMFYRINF